MPNWKKYFFIGAGFGTAALIVTAVIMGVWMWFESRPQKQKPWNQNAIIATFEYPGTESGPEEKDGFRPDQIVMYYTLENKTDFDYRMPARNQIEFNAKLKRENSLSANSQLLSLDEQPVFLPANQRVRISVHLRYPVKKDFGPEDTRANRDKRRKAIADYLNEEFTNLDGFVVFDLQNRYQINFPNGWKTMDLK